jgi:hypothetical protein
MTTRLRSHQCPLHSRQFNRAQHHSDMNNLHPSRPLRQTPAFRSVSFSMLTHTITVHINAPASFISIFADMTCTTCTTHLYPIIIYLTPYLSHYWHLRSEKPATPVHRLHIFYSESLAIQVSATRFFSNRSVFLPRCVGQYYPSVLTALSHFFTRRIGCTFISHLRRLL